MNNQFYRDMVDELRDSLSDGFGIDDCADDWNEFYDMIDYIARKSADLARPGMTEDEIDDCTGAIYDAISGSRADLPSVEKFIYAEIERVTQWTIL